MNFTNTDRKADKVFSFPSWRRELHHQKAKEQTNEQVFWQVFDQIIPIQAKTKQELRDEFHYYRSYKDRGVQPLANAMVFADVS